MQFFYSLFIKVPEMPVRFLPCDGGKQEDFLIHSSVFSRVWLRGPHLLPAMLIEGSQT